MFTGLVCEDEERPRRVFPRFSHRPVHLIIPDPGIVCLGVEVISVLEEPVDAVGFEQGVVVVVCVLD